MNVNVLVAWMKVLDGNCTDLKNNPISDREPVTIFAKQALNDYEQGSKFLGRPPFFINTVGFTFAYYCTFRFVDVDVREPVARPVLLARSR